MTITSIIGIAGFGREGRAVYDYFKGKAEIHIFDEHEPDLGGIDATFHEELSIPADIPLVFKSPGIPSSKLILEGDATQVTTLMALLVERIGAQAIGITGTKGKSTTASLINHILAQTGRDTVLLGNIGTADMTLVDESKPERVYVLELSSYQCEYLTASPHIAVMTNLYPEHLTHHGSFDAYREAKLNIARFQTADDIFVNGSDIDTAFAGKLVHPVTSKPFTTKLLGEHNQKNCALATLAVGAVGITEDEARNAIETFEPLPYRLEEVGTRKGITFYDDSLATIPEATLASIASLPRVDTLILGGEDRGIPFAEFADELAETSITTFIAFPDTGAKMVARIDPSRVVQVSSMEEAVRAAYERTSAGGVVLLSNASPSFNLFKDYQDKSTQFRAAIQKFGV